MGKSLEGMSELSKNRWDARLYESKHSFVWKFGEDLIELLSPQPGERILDLGCGTGHLTAQIASSGARAMGMDNSPSMIDQARKTYPQVEFEVGDATKFHFDEPFDAVFSNAALHWIKEADRVADCVWRALEPGGRFVAEFGGKGNVKKICAAAARSLEALGLALKADLSAWYFPSLDEYATVLEKQGFEVTYARLFDRPTPLDDEAGLRNWIRMFWNNFLSLVPPVKQDQFIRNVEEILRPEIYQNGKWVIDYRRLRVVALRTSEPVASKPFAAGSAG